MSKIQPLLTSYKMGDLLLKNRLVIAPMTRSRANNKEPPIAQVILCVFKVLAKGKNA